MGTFSFFVVLQSRLDKETFFASCTISNVAFFCPLDARVDFRLHEDKIFAPQLHVKIVECELGKLLSVDVFGS